MKLDIVRTTGATKIPLATLRAQPRSERFKRKTQPQFTYISAQNSNIKHLKTNSYKHKRKKRRPLLKSAPNLVPSLSIDALIHLPAQDSIQTKPDRRIHTTDPLE